jgi:signal peptidase I
MRTRRSWAFKAFVLMLAACVGCNGEYSSGDRVLVAKCLYESKLKPPARFDVVVFKFPRSPMKANVPTNYIKRLLGLPGEIVAIFFGQLFRMTPTDLPLPGEPPVENPLDLWKIDNQPRGDEFNQKIKQAFSERKFEMIRKPPPVMMAMRRIVNDNNFQPKDLANLPSRWQPRDGSGWTLSPDRKTLTRKADSKAADANDVDWVTYQHLVRPEPPIVGNVKLKPRLITDTLGYNDFNQTGKRPHNANWVGDLMLEAKVTVTQPTGEFLMELNRGVDRFQAKWDLASGQCTLWRIPEKGAAKELGSAPTNLRGAGTHEVRFANFDARLTVWVDNSLPFGDGVAYDPPELPALADGKLLFDDFSSDWGPRPNDLTRPASFGVRGASVDVADVRVWRDTYYTTRGQSQDVSLTTEGLEDPSAWEEFKRATPSAMYVYPGHYLCLGDNSTHSSDGRDWGLVPERLMLGRALTVYYPLDRAGLIR